MPAGVHNGSLIQGDRRNAIIEGIAHGQSVASISRRLHCSPRVVVAIREIEWQRVAERKSVLAAQSERIATLAADRSVGLAIVFLLVALAALVLRVASL
jgi:hypothetical protein